MKKLVCSCVVIFLSVSFYAGAGITTVVDTDVYPDWFVGTGQSNGHFVVNTNTDQTGTILAQTGIRAKERWIGAYTPDSAGNYTAPTGESTISGSSSTIDPGTAKWNFDFSIYVDGSLDENVSGLSDDISVIFSVHSDLTWPIPIEITADLTDTGNGYYLLQDSQNLLQDSQNLGFGSTGFDPYAEGEYTFGITVYDGPMINDLPTGTMISDVGMIVNTVVPAPGAFLLGGIGLSMVSWIRRRKSI